MSFPPQADLASSVRPPHVEWYTVRASSPRYRTTIPRVLSAASRKTAATPSIPSNTWSSTLATMSYAGSRGFAVAPTAYVRTATASAASASGWNRGGDSRLTTAATYASNGSTAMASSSPLRARRRTRPATFRFPTRSSGTPAASRVSPRSLEPFHRIRPPTAARVTRPADSTARLPSALHARIVSPSRTTRDVPPERSTRMNRGPVALGGETTTPPGEGGISGRAGAGGGTRRGGSRGGAPAQPAKRRSVTTTATRI